MAAVYSLLAYHKSLSFFLSPVLLHLTLVGFLKKQKTCISIFRIILYFYYHYSKSTLWQEPFFRADTLNYDLLVLIYLHFGIKL